MTGLSKWSGLAVVALGLLAVAERRASADTIVYATADGGGNSTFGTLDLTTGQFNSISYLSVLAVGLTADTNGNLYASATNGNLYTISGAGVASQFGTASAPVPQGGFQQGFFGLAYAGANGFYGTNDNSGGNGAVLDQVTSNGNGVSPVGSLTTQGLGTGSGDLAYGPGGSLYASLTIQGSDGLYSVNTSTGAATEVGTGFQNANHVLNLVNAGGVLYGIDSQTNSGFGSIGIYTINTTTGVATATGVNVTGLASGLTLDTAVGFSPNVVPEPSSLVLMGLGGLAGLGYAWRRRKRAA